MTGSVFWQDSLDLIPVKQHKQGVMFIKYFSTKQISRHHVLPEKNVNSYLNSSAQHNVFYIDSSPKMSRDNLGHHTLSLWQRAVWTPFQIFSPVFQWLPAVSVHYSPFAAHLLKHIFCNFLLLTFVSVVLSWYHTLTYIPYVDSWVKSDRLFLAYSH